MVSSPSGAPAHCTPPAAKLKLRSHLQPPQPHHSVTHSSHHTPDPSDATLEKPGSCLYRHAMTEKMSFEKCVPVHGSLYSLACTLENQAWTNCLEGLIKFPSNSQLASVQSPPVDGCIEFPYLIRAPLPPPAQGKHAAE